MLFKWKSVSNCSCKSRHFFALFFFFRFCVKYLMLKETAPTFILAVRCTLKLTQGKLSNPQLLTGLCRYHLQIVMQTLPYFFNYPALFCKP